MPEERKRRFDDARRVATSVIDEVFGIGVEVIRQVAPKCAFCSGSAFIQCASCGRLCCPSHAFVNARVPKDPTSYQSVCSGCMAEKFDFVMIGDADMDADPSAWSYHMKPWEVLEVPWHAREDEIKAAFKKKARECHPDHGGNEDDMKLLVAARDYMLRRRKGGR